MLAALLAVPLAVLGAVAGDAFDYVAASQWERFDPKGKGAGRRPPLVLRLDLR